MYIFIYVCMYECALCACSCPQWPEEDIRFPGTGVTGDHEPPDIHAGSSATTANVLNCWGSSPASSSFPKRSNGKSGMENSFYVKIHIIQNIKTGKTTLLEKCFPHKTRTWVRFPKPTFRKNKQTTNKKTKTLNLYIMHCNPRTGKYRQWDVWGSPNRNLAYLINSTSGETLSLNGVGKGGKIA